MAMADTYTQIFIHVVFAVRERGSLIRSEWRNELFKYITGIFKNKGLTLIAIGGVEDHIHILFGLAPSIALSDLVRDVKTASGAFINEKKFVKGKFYWQEGFGAFSYSRSQIEAVAKYVLDQEKHHAKRTFREEYVELLDGFEVEYQDKYLFDWIG
jgi:REP element-mobilizing transposase RayT